MRDNVTQDLTKNTELINAIKYSDEQNARITSDKVVDKAILNHVATNFDFYKRYSDDREFKADFDAVMYNVVKDIILKGLTI